MKNHLFLSKIKPNELIQFGLNPYHWLSFEENEHDAKLVHIDDPELKFRIVFNPLNVKNPIRFIEWILD